MKRLLIVLLVAALWTLSLGQAVVRRPIVVGGGGSGHNGYTWYRTITIDGSLVPATLTNYPLVVAGTYTYLKTVGNGGEVTDAQGDDVIFTSDSGCTTKLDHEVERYVASTGEVVYWVEVPSVATGSNTVIYMCYANASITSSQQAVAATWSNGFKRVYHCNDNAASTTVVDSLGISNAVEQLSNTSALTIAGHLDGGLAAVDTTSGDVAVVSSSSDLDMGSGFTADFTMKTDQINKPAYSRWDGSTVSGYFWYIDGNWYAANSTPAFVTVANGQTTDDTWHRFALVYTGTNLISYKDGVQVGTAAMTSVTESSSTLKILGWSAGVFEADFDEVRFSQTPRTVDWLLAEWRNHSSPGTFYSVGSAVP